VCIPFQALDFFLSFYHLSIGTIHGDYNEQNIIVSPCTSGLSQSEYRLAGVLDFGDTSYSCLVFDLAIAMTYLMLQSGNLETGGLVLAGYRTMRTVPSDEINILKVIIFDQTRILSINLFY
jgi:hydroxylysine kinase